MTKTKNQIATTKPRELIGSVINLNGKTMRIRVDAKFPHPKYTKIVKSHKHYLADFDSKEEVVIGDEVVIQECKPISAKKTWKFIKVIKKIA